MTTEQEEMSTFKPINPIDLNGVERAVRMLRLHPNDQRSVEFWTESLKGWAKDILR